MTNLLLPQLLYHQNIKKTANFLLNQPLFFQNRLYLYLQQQRITRVIEKFKQSPFALRIENTNFCNGRCFMCPHSSMKRKQGTMSKKLYQKIINQAVSLGINFINLHNFGEPLLDQDFIWRIKFAKSQGIEKISTNTNGLLLTPKLSKEIIKSGLDEIYFSLDAASSPTYKKIRLGLNYKIVHQNLNNLIKIKQQLKSSTPIIIVDFLESSLNKHETKLFVQKWQPKVDHVCISQLHDWSEKITSSVDNRFSNYVSYSQSPCRLPFTEMTINWDGSVSLCCQDIEGEVIIGNINHQTISQVWQSKKLESIRQKHLSLTTDQLMLCSKCKLRTFWWTF